MDHQFRMGVSGYVGGNFPGVGKPVAASEKPRYRRVLKVRQGQIKKPMDRLRTQAFRFGLKVLHIGDAFSVAATLMREFAEAFKYKEIIWRLREDGVVDWVDGRTEDRSKKTVHAQHSLSSVADMMRANAKANDYGTMSLHLREDGVVIFTPDPHRITSQDRYKERQHLRRYVLTDGEVTEKRPRMPGRQLPRLNTMPGPGKSRMGAYTTRFSHERPHIHDESKCVGLQADMIIVDDPHAPERMTEEQRCALAVWYQKPSLLLSSAQIDAEKQKMVDAERDGSIRPHVLPQVQIVAAKQRLHKEKMRIHQEWLDRQTIDGERGG